MKKGTSGKNKETVISAYVGGQLKKVGKLVEEGGRKVFIQRIKKQDILQIRGAAGVDLKYDPPLPGDCIIRHTIKDESGNETTYEIPLAALRNHEKMTISKVGSIHPARMYLSYKYWRNRTAEELQPSLFPDFQAVDSQ